MSPSARSVAVFIVRATDSPLPAPLELPILFPARRPLGARPRAFSRSTSAPTCQFRLPTMTSPSVLPSSNSSLTTSTSFGFPPASIRLHSADCSISWRAGRDQSPPVSTDLFGCPTGRHAPWVRRPGRLDHFDPGPRSTLWSSLCFSESARRPAQDPLLGSRWSRDLGETPGARQLQLSCTERRSRRGHACGNGRNS